jgi:hypothetical protein
MHASEPPPRGAAGSPARRPALLATKRDWAACTLALLAVLAFFHWTAATSGGLPPPWTENARYGDHYNLLLHGLLKGQLHLDVPTDPAMLGTPNPYDPKVWVPHGFMYDASFYGGKYYIYYGIVPLLVFLLPFRLLTGSDLWLGTATEIATVLVFLALAWLWLRIRRDYFPRVASSLVFTSILALGLVTALPSLASRPMMYEFAIATGCLFATLMLHCVYSGLASRNRTAWMAAAGVCLGLAFGSRPTFLLAILAPAWVLFHGLIRERPWRSAWWAGGSVLRAGLGFAASFGAIFFTVLLYNRLRFSSFFDFGYAYLLQDPVSDLKHYWSASHFWYNFRNYYTSPLQWSRYFPFLTTGPFPEAPKTFYAAADLYGILKYAPIVWFVLAAPLAWRNRPGPAAASWAAVLGMLFLAYLGPGVLLLFGGTAFPRYAPDFLPPLVLVATFGACALDAAVSASWIRHAVRSAWTAAAAISVGIAAVHSIPLQGHLTVQKGNAYVEKVARTLNYPTFLYERARDWRYGAITWRTRFPAQPVTPREKLVETPNATLLVEYLPDSRARFGLEIAGGGGALWGESVAMAADKLSTLSASFGSLYPSTEHPYFVKHEPSAIRNSSVTVVLDGRIVLQGLRPLSGVDCRDIRIADGRARPGWFSGDVREIARNRLSLAELTPDFTPRSLRIDLPAGLAAGRWPLISAGTSAGGDLLFLETGTDGTARWGYFSTGSPPQTSPPFPLPREGPLEFAVRMEALEASGRVAGPARPLTIEVGGRATWMTQVAFHACWPDSIRLGANSVAAPSVEPAFPGSLRWIETAPRLRPASPREHLFLRVVFPAHTRWGLRLPLLITGVPGAYDGIQVVHYGGNVGRFVLDHGGDIRQEGPALGSLGGEALHDIEIITPVFSLPRDERRPARGTVVVKMDGLEVLRFDSELFPAQLDEVVVGENPFGGPAEKRFLGALLLQRWVEPPAP